MIIRYHLKCAGCKSRIALRLQIGVDSIQPFYFVCQKCGAPTKGVHKIDYEKDPPTTDLSLEDTKLIYTYWKKPEQTITIAPDLPCVILPNDNPASPYPFIYQSELMENPAGLIEYQSRIGSFRDSVEKDWPKYRRLISYYFDRNWKQFDKEWKNILGRKVPAPKVDLDRHDFFQRVMDMFFVSIQPNINYLGLIKELNDFVSAVSQKDKDVLVQFANSIEDQELILSQSNLLERLSFIVESFSALASGFPILFYDNENKLNLSGIRIMRDDFEILKSHYLGCFEIAHKVLKLLVGMINVFIRGNADAFPNGKPKSLENFTKLPNAQKPKFLDSNVFPEIASQWEICFDRETRNAIGHYGIRHDLRTGMLVLDDKNISIPYSEFVLRNLELLPLILLCFHVVKKIYAIKIILG
jgi:hypothetical protein